MIHIRHIVFQIGFVMVTLFFTTVAAQAENGPVFKAQQVSASTWYVEGLSALGTPANQNFISNAAFVITPAGVVVIDALGSPALAVRLLAEIKKVTPTPVTHVLVTHYHADHIYGLQTMKAAGAKIFAHEAARIYLNSDAARLRLEASRQELAPWVNEDTRLVAADEWIDSDRSITVGGIVFEIKRVGPSHTPEDIAIYLPSEKVLFAGDLVFRGRIPFVGNADSKGWISALDEIEKLNPQIVIPGHGAYSTKPGEDIAFTRNYLKYLRESMSKAAIDLDPFDEAYQQADWSEYEGMPLFRAANRMNAYNVYLSIQAE